MPDTTEASESLVRDFLGSWQAAQPRNVTMNDGR